METRLYEADASNSTPDMDTLTSNGFPTGGNPALGIAPTKPGAAWFYGLSEEIRNAIVNAGITPDNDDLAQLFKAMRSWQSLPTGFHMGWLSKDPIPENWLIMNGQSVSKSTYADLNAFINSDGSLDDSGDSSKFIIPDMTGRVWQGCSSYSDVLVAKEAGLPNILGQVGYLNSYHSNLPTMTGVGVGALHWAATSTNTEMALQNLTAVCAGLDIGFNASQSNATYSGSNTVQPPSRQALMIIKV